MPSTRTLSTFLKYGVPSDLAMTFEASGLTVTAVRAISVVQLVSKYGVQESAAKLVKQMVERAEIPDDTVQRLLDEANFTCCVCHGMKSTAYLIHHIDEYQNSQSNEYINLAALCPACHDGAHRPPGLTLGLDTSQIHRRKFTWAAAVRTRNAHAAAAAGKVTDVDFVNIERVLLLLAERGILVQEEPPAGDVMDMSPTPSTSGFRAGLQYKAGVASAFMNEVPHLPFRPLDDFLTHKTALADGVIGQWVHYAGGLYGKCPEYPVTPASPACRLFMRRNGVCAEWLLTPMNLFSMTACTGLGDHRVRLVYGRIQSVRRVKLREKPHVQLDIRPYLFGQPEVTPDRTPIIHLVKNSYDEPDDDWDGPVEPEAWNDPDEHAGDDPDPDDAF